MSGTRLLCLPTTGTTLQAPQNAPRTWGKKVIIASSYSPAEHLSLIKTEGSLIHPLLLNLFNIFNLTEEYKGRGSVLQPFPAYILHKWIWLWNLPPFKGSCFNTEILTLASFYTYAHNFVLYAFVFVKINFVQINKINLKWSWEIRRGSPHPLLLYVKDPQQEEITALLLLYYPAEWKISFLPRNSQLETITTLNFAFLQ